jgi:hypothetical protein
LGSEFSFLRCIDPIVIYRSQAILLIIILIEGYECSLLVMPE